MPEIVTPAAAVTSSPAAVAPATKAVAPATKAVAAPAAPAAASPVEVPVAPPAQSDAAAKKLAELEAAHQKKLREHIIERRKWDAERKASSERLTKLEQLERLQREAKLNPPAYLKSVYGDDWYDKLVEAKISGAPAADVIASEVAKLREEFETRITEQERARQQRSIDEAKRGLALEAVDFYRRARADYPLLARLGDEPAVGAAIAQRIEQEFYRSEQRDESGAVVRQGRVLTPAEAAEKLESELFVFAEEAAAAEKYRARLAERLTPKATQASIGGPRLQQQTTVQQSSRKTLSNDLTGTTPERKPAMSAAEKRERAIAAFNGLYQRRG